MDLTLADVAAFMAIAGLVVYAVTGGADFGGGVWDLFATGPRAREQRKLIEQALAPIWEANHVWLIFVVVVLFTAFPLAYSVASIALHIPLTVFLIGIVLRGSAFVFRQYGDADPRRELLWSRVFAVASIVSPLFLGIIVGAITSGAIRVDAKGMPTTGYLAGWIGVFPLAVGLFTVSLFAFLAAVYLTLEAETDALREDFRRRALIAGIGVAPCALVAALTATGPGTVHFADAFLHSPWTWPLQGATAFAAVGALVALWKRRYRTARVLAVAQTTLILVGWALAQRPFLIAPDVTVENAAAPASTLGIMLAIVAAGALLLIPSLYVLFRVFKRAR